MLDLCEVKKSYLSPQGGRVPVIDVPSFHLEAGEQAALRGGSGSGKTTLLNLIAGILKSDSGTITVDGCRVDALSEAGRDRFRAVTMSYVFQTFNLLAGYTALDNVLLGMMFGPGPDPDYARGLLERMGLGDRMKHKPHQLSVGQQQRVAVARALANRPKLVLADEPTGNLDPRRAREALDLLQGACRERNAALLLVSHDRDILASFSRVEDLAAVNRAGPGGPHEPAAGEAPR